MDNEYGYRDNANPAAFEMDNLRQRVYDVETRLGELRGSKRLVSILGALLVGSVTFGFAVAIECVMPARKPADSCRDAIVEAPVHQTGLVCPHPDQQMSEHTIVLPNPQSDVWGLRCLCKR